MTVHTVQSGIGECACMEYIVMRRRTLLVCCKLRFVGILKCLCGATIYCISLFSGRRQTTLISRSGGDRY